MQTMILGRLKSETAHEHAAVERLVEQLGYLRSLDDYRRLLERFWGFYVPLERQIAARPEWPSYAIEIAQRQHAPALRRDLLTLGHTEQSLRALPLCEAIPPNGGIAYTVGCMYVLEGATLGGQVVGRQLHDALDLSPLRGASFFASYRGDVGAMWRAFRALVEAVAIDMPAEHELLRGAHATFQALKYWLMPGATP